MNAPPGSGESRLVTERDVARDIGRCDLCGSAPDGWAWLCEACDV